MLYFSAVGLPRLDLVLGENVGTTALLGAGAPDDAPIAPAPAANASDVAGDDASAAYEAGSHTFATKDFYDFNAATDNSGRAGLISGDRREELDRQEADDEAIQNYRDAVTAAAEWREQWLAQRQQYGSLNLTGAEYQELSDQLDNDPEFREQTIQRMMREQGMTREEAEQGIRDFQDWTRISQIPEDQRTPEQQRRFEEVEQSQDGQAAAQAADRQQARLEQRGLTRGTGTESGAPTQNVQSSSFAASMDIDGDAASVPAMRSQTAFAATADVVMLRQSNDPAAAETQTAEVRPAVAMANP
jgi:hypothetical protein